jgi:hypothetical protein
MARWEYFLANLTVTSDRSVPYKLRLGEALTAVEEELDELGRAGWEAVGPVTVSALHGGDQQQTTVLLFKRPVEPEDTVP